MKLFIATYDIDTGYEYKHYTLIYRPICKESVQQYLERIDNSLPGDWFLIHINIEELHNEFGKDVIWTNMPERM